MDVHGPSVSRGPAQIGWDIGRMYLQLQYGISYDMKIVVLFIAPEACKFQIDYTYIYIYIYMYVNIYIYKHKLIFISGIHYLVRFILSSSVSNMPLTWYHHSATTDAGDSSWAKREK